MQSTTYAPLLVLASASLAFTALGCADAKTAADVDPCSPEADAKYAGETAKTAAVTGGETAVEGVKTFGKSVGGFFKGGSTEAAEEWKEGAAQTKQTAQEGGRETKQTAGDRPCR